ncbi:MAG: PAS domain-containing protein [Deltaproteobacteria bacterium]|nr:PAS domain-containing protein [Deltaproteobacteria bacterium]
MEGIPDIGFEDLFNAVPCYIAVLDRDLSLIRTNHIADEHFGPPGGRKCFEVFKKSSEPCEDCAALSTFEDGLIRQHESETITVDGRNIVLLVRTRPIRAASGRIVAVMEVSTDVTELKRLQEELERRRRRRRRDYDHTRQLFDEVPCYVSVMDESYTILETNRLFKESLGDVPGAKCYELFKSRTAPCVPCPVAETFTDGLPHSHESRIRALSGREVDVVVRSAPMRDSDGRVARVMEMSVDVTEVKNLQRELARLGKMSAHAAHNIKGILTGLKGGIFMVNEGRKRNDTPVVERGWEMVQHNVERIATQSLDILSFAKKRVPEHKQIDLDQLFGVVFDGARSAAEQGGVQLVSSVDPDARVLEADPRYVSQALTVLVDNAIEACVEAGDAAPRTVTLASKPADGGIRIDVSDNGAGMDEDVREHVFEDFYSTKGSMGTGLGLVVVQKIIGEHGGTIDFTSTPGRGTTFTIRFPEKTR